MNKTIGVYLAGGMRSNWQEFIQKTFASYEDVVFIDPMYNNTKNLQEIVGIDLFGIKQCDVVFAYLEKDNPAGHAMMVEIGYALGLGKTIIFVNEQTETNLYTTFANVAVDILPDCFASGITALYKMLNIFYKKTPSTRINLNEMLDKN